MGRLFNGTTERITVPHSPELNPAAITVAGWIYPTATIPATYPTIVFRGVVSGGVKYFWGGSGTANKLSCYISSAGGTTQAFVDPGSHTLSTNVWVHTAFTYSSVVGLTTYVGGASDGTAAANGAMQAVTIPLIINDASLPSRMADIAIWNTALSAKEIGALALGFRPGWFRAGNLVAWWQLRGYLSPEPDSTAFANFGLVTGTRFTSDPPLLKPIQMSPFKMTMPKKARIAAISRARGVSILQAVQRGSNW